MNPLAWIAKILTALGNASVRQELVNATQMFERFAERMERRCEKLEHEIKLLKAEIKDCHAERDSMKEQIAELKASMT